MNGIGPRTRTEPGKEARADLGATTRRMSTPRRSKRWRAAKRIRGWATGGI